MDAHNNPTTAPQSLKQQLYSLVQRQIAGLAAIPAGEELPAAGVNLLANLHRMYHMEVKTEAANEAAKAEASKAATANPPRTCPTSPPARPETLRKPQDDLAERIARVQQRFKQMQHKHASGSEASEATELDHREPVSPNVLPPSLANDPFWMYVKNGFGDTPIPLYMYEDDPNYQHDAPVPGQVADTGA